MKPDLEIHKHIKVKAIFKRMNQTNESTKHLITVLVLVCVCSIKYNAVRVLCCDG